MAAWVFHELLVCAAFNGLSNIFCFFDSLKEQFDSLCSSQEHPQNGSSQILILKLSSTFDRHSNGWNAPKSTVVSSFLNDPRHSSARITFSLNHIGERRRHLQAWKPNNYGKSSAEKNVKKSSLFRLKSGLLWSGSLHSNFWLLPGPGATYGRSDRIRPT